MFVSYVIYGYMIFVIVIEKKVKLIWLDDYLFFLFLVYLLKRDYLERLYLVMDYFIDGLYLVMDYFIDWFFLLSGCLFGWYVGFRISRVVIIISFFWIAEIIFNKYFVFCFKGFIFIKV